MDITKHMALIGIKTKKWNKTGIDPDHVQNSVTNSVISPECPNWWMSSLIT